MPLTVAKPRSLWEDRFGRPTIESLLAACPRSVLPFIDHARERFKRVKGVAEQLAWQGIPWRWTLTYSHPQEVGRSFAFVVPDPARPRLAVPIPDRVLGEVSLKRASKPLRDAIQQAPIVGTVRWCQWELQTRSLIEEVVDLAILKVSTEAALAFPPAR